MYPSDYTNTHTSEKSEQSTKKIEKSEVYDKLVDGFNNCNTSINLEAAVESDVIIELIDEIIIDYPEFFWIDEYAVITGDVDSSCNFKPINGYSSSKLRAMTDEIRTAGDKFMETVPAGLDEYGKALYAHDYIAENTVYDVENMDAERVGLWNTAYGCLVQGKAVCGGYAKAYKYLLNRLGIDCRTISGTAWSLNSSDNKSPEGHMWNYVKINNASYWVDVTWDDINDTEKAGTQKVHTYFLVDDKRFFRTHSVSSKEKNVPTCFSMDCNYYVRNNAYVTGYSLEATGNAMASSASDGVSEVMFSDEASYKLAIQELFEEGRVWELSDYIQLGDSLTYSFHDDTYVIAVFY